LNDLKIVPKESVRKEATNEKTPASPEMEPCENEGFRQQRRRKRNRSSEDQNANKKPSTQLENTSLTVPHKPVTRNYYAPLRSADMDVETAGQHEISEEQQKQEPASKQGRPPPIVLTSSTNLIQLENKLKGSFEFRNTRNGTRVVTREMDDYKRLKEYSESNGLHFFTFHPKSVKPLKAVIRHLPSDTPAEDISKGLEELGFGTVSVKQLTAMRPSPKEGNQQVTLQLFLITLPRCPKSTEIFKLTSLCHIIIKVEAYSAQTGLTQCYNCQNFGHIWANSRQPPRCLWCGGGHLHKECPEKGKEETSDGVAH
jgi:hypothetical protein